MFVITKTLSAEEIMRSHYSGNYLNTHLVEYGNIRDDIAYEIRKINMPYLEFATHHLFFVAYNPASGATEALTKYNLYGSPEYEVREQIQDLKAFFSLKEAL
jgi:hypothetical protein